MKDKYSQRLHSVIPGGAHTYSRGDDQYPDNAPSILSRGEGAYVWDADGNKFLDYGMGLRSVNIGYGYKPIADAAYQEILKGNNLTRASETELFAAEKLCSLISSAEMVKFAKHGSTVTTAAVKLARAYTGKKLIAVCAEQPFFSFDDWFIGSTVMNKGVPEEISSLTVKFNFNQIQTLQKLFDEHPGEIACVIMEPCTTVAPCASATQPGENFLHEVQRLCHKHGVVFILDEMISGFRWHLNGAQKYFNITPDISTFGKAMANGFAVAALTGKKEIMIIGGILEEGAERVFLTSTTHGAEMGTLGAFLKTVEILENENVIEHFWSYGKKLMDGFNSIATQLGIENHFYFEGFPCSPSYTAKDKNGNASLAFRTLFSREMIKRKILMPWVALCFMHKDSELHMTLEKGREALEAYKRALEEGPEKYLEGSNIIKPVFRKYN